MCMIPFHSMTPTYRYSVLSSPMPPLDLNEEDHTHHQFFCSTNYHQASSSLSYSILFNPDQDQGGGSYCWGPKQLQSDEEAEKIVPCSGSWDHGAVEKNGNRSSDLKKEDGGNDQNIEDMNSMKWMPSKMRILRRMMLSDSNENQNSSSPPPLGTGIRTATNNISTTVRVCADCHTTKTPLWRTGPTGPKSLCNACGIRQRKARRAAAVAANGTIDLVKENKFESKGKKRSKTDEYCEAKLQKKRKLGRKLKPNKNKFSFEELRIRLSNKLPLHQVFPQDEKEAAILLMALSHG